jgi:histidine ammonia-lyase
MSVHSISSNKDNQDVVSMGFDAGLLTLEVIDNAFDIAGILAVAVSQAIALASVADTIGARSSQVVAAIRAVAPVINDDRDIAAAIVAAARLVGATSP